MRRLGGWRQCQCVGHDTEQFGVLHLAVHSLGTGAEEKAVAYFEIKSGAGLATFGAATDTNIEIASLKAVLSALNRCCARQ